MGGTIVLVLWASTAAATSSDGAPAAAGNEAERLMRQGIDLRRAGRDEEALDCFRRADGLAPSARARAQVGLAEQALGRWVDASRDLASALRSKEDPWIVKNRAVLESAQGIVRDHVGKVMVSGSPAGAIVLINGDKAGTLPLVDPIVVAAGESVVAVEAPGHVSLSRKITVSPRGLARETIDLPVDVSSQATAERSAARIFGTVEPPPSETKMARPTTVAPSIAALESPSPATPPKHKRTDGRVAAWIAAGLGVAALGVGAVMDLRYVDKVHSFNAPESTCAAGAPNRGSSPDCEPAYDSLMQTKKIAVAGFVSAAAFGLVSAAIFYWAASGAEGGAASSLACTSRGIESGCGIVF